MAFILVEKFGEIKNIAEPFLIFFSFIGNTKGFLYNTRSLRSSKNTIVVSSLTINYSNVSGYKYTQKIREGC